MQADIVNTIQIVGAKETLKKIKKSVCSAESVFDFNGIVPMPESLNLPSGDITATAMHIALAPPEERESLLPDDSIPENPKTIEEWVDLGEAYIQNEKMYGTPTWYGWRYDNWGVKANSIDAVMLEEQENCLSYRFGTRKYEPDILLIKLSEQFPNVLISVDVSTEDYGDYHVFYKAGERKEIEVFEGIKRGCDEIRENIELMAENILDLIRLKFKNLREDLS